MQKYFSQKKYFKILVIFLTFSILRFWISPDFEKSILRTQFLIFLRINLGGFYWGCLWLIYRDLAQNIIYSSHNRPMPSQLLNVIFPPQKFLKIDPRHSNVDIFGWDFYQHCTRVLLTYVPSFSQRYGVQVENLAMRCFFQIPLRFLRIPQRKLEKARQPIR